MDDETLDPRQQRTRRAVLAAARVVLRRDGMNAVTVEGIAAEAGVARSTLYRNWASREELLDDAISEFATPAPAPHGENPLDELVGVFEQLASNLDGTEWGATLPAIVAAIDASRELETRYHRFVDGRRSEVDQIIRRAIAAGLLAGDTNPDDLIDDLAGPLFYRRLVRRIPSSPEWTRSHTERIISAHAPAHQ